MIYCPLPWIHTAIRNNGDFRICCQANASAGRGMLQNESGEVLNARNTSLESARASLSAKEIRKALLAGQWPETCKRCQTEEESGIRSRRIYENESWNRKFSPERAAALTDLEGNFQLPPDAPLFIDVRFGNKCNLKCRMCGPADSDFWYSDQAELWGPEFKDTHQVVKLEKNSKGQWADPKNSYDWYSKNADFWDELERLGSQIQKINIVGGEPLLIQQHYLFLEKMVQSGAAKEIELEYNTNLTILPEKALHLWKNFKIVRIGVSLDGVDINNTYIRHPSHWPNLLKNLRRLNEAEGPFDLWISATIQSLNVFEITDMIRWKLTSPGLERFNPKARLPVLTTHPLHKPEVLNIKNLPAPVKQDVRDHYAAFIAGLPEWVEAKSGLSKKEICAHIENLLSRYLKYMEVPSREKSFQNFAPYILGLDRLRHEKFSEGSPRLHRSLKRHGFWSEKELDSTPKDNTTIGHESAEHPVVRV